MPGRCTTSRANDRATTTGSHRSSRETYSTLSLNCSEGYEVDVEQRATFWCWRFLWRVLDRRHYNNNEPPKRKNRKVKNLFLRFVAKNCLFCFDTRQKGGRRKLRSQEKRKKFLIAGAAVASRRSEVWAFVANHVPSIGVPIIWVGLIN